MADLSARGSVVTARRKEVHDLKRRGTKRGVILIEALLGAALLLGGLASLAHWRIHMHKVQGELARARRKALERGRAELMLKRVFSRLLPSPRARWGEGAQTQSSLKTDERGHELWMLYRPLSPQFWSLGVVAKGRLFVDEEGHLLLHSVPLLPKRESVDSLESTVAPMRLLSYVKALSFEFVSASFPFDKTRDTAQALWLAPEGEIPSMLKVRIEFLNKEIWEVVHLFAESALYLKC